MAYTRQPAGRLQRLSVAVLIDNLRSTDADGKVTETPLTEAQIAGITTLVKDAVGFDETRGDTCFGRQPGLPAEAALDRAGRWTRFQSGSSQWCAISPSCWPAS